MLSGLFAFVDALLNRIRPAGVTGQLDGDSSSP
jgi:hypothetical protein